MAKKKKTPTKSMEELTKKLEKELGDKKDIDKEEFDNVLKKILKKPKKPNS